MTATFVIAATASVGLAALLVLALRERGPMAAWCAAFAGTLVVWTTADAAHELTGSSTWRAVDVSISPLTIPVGLHLTATFAGRSRALRPALVLAWGWFGALALANAPMLGGGPPALAQGPWTVAFLVGIGWATALAALTLAGVWRGAGSADERARAQLLLLALPFAAVFGMTDLVETFVPGTPQLAPVGVLGSALATSAVALRWRLLGREISTAAWLQALVIAAIAALAFVLAAVSLAGRAAALLLVAVAVTGALVAATRLVVADAATSRARRAELERLGRASAQMAHDLKNPIAAVRGAADVIVFELERESGARDAMGQAELLALARGIRDDADRMTRLVDDYRRFVRIEPVAVDVALTPWMRDCARAVERAARPGAQVFAETPPDLGSARFDPDLVAQVIDNLAQNAFDALAGSPAGGGHVVLRLEPASRAGREGITIVVEDDGPGMDAQTRERATEEFFTTRATGSGLGLAFSRRVAEAHGGALALRPREGGGTRAELWVPRAG